MELEVRILNPYHLIKLKLLELLLIWNIYLFLIAAPIPNDDYCLTMLQINECMMGRSTKQGRPGHRKTPT